VAKAGMEVCLVETYLADGGKLEDFFSSWNKVRNVLEACAVISCA